MVNRLNKIYTKSGDSGETSVCSGLRTSKSSLQIEVIGDLDELNAHLGMVRTLAVECKPPADGLPYIREYTTEIFAIQKEIFNAGAAVAGSNLGSDFNQATRCLEAEIDLMNPGPLEGFVIPGTCRVEAQIHIARAVCRRAERNLVALWNEKQTDSGLLRYLNRLSDFLFVLGRVATLSENGQEYLWKGK